MAEQEAATTTPEKPAETPPKASLADQYEFEAPEASREPAPETSAEPPGVRAQEPEETPAPAPTPERRRDPETGQFLPREVEQPATPQHPTALVQMALDYGVPDADISSFTTDQLLSVCRGIQQQVSRQQVQSSQEHLTHDAIASGQQRVQEARAARQDSPAAQGTDDGEFTLPPELSQYEEPVQRAFNGLAKRLDHALARVKQLEESQSQVTGFLRAKETESVQQRCDRAFAKHKTLLGDGNLNDFQASDPMMIRRRAVLDTVQRDSSKAPLEAKIDRAVKLLYGEAAAPAPPRATKAREEEWAAAGLARPTQRNGAPEPKGVKAAEQSVANRLRDLGNDTEESGSADDNDFI